MENKDIKELLKLLQGTDVSEIEVERDGTKVRIKRGFAQPAEIMVAAAAQPAFAPQPVATAQPVTAAAQAAEVAPMLDESARYVKITSPIVGSFYRSPTPEAPPFVDVGSEVRKGQVICIIEAMKLMNEIEADADGRIVKVLVQNGQSVEYGQPLFLVDPR
ncbi:MAG: acetyl-CoA carboxylase biotin carboxyl carrier protein [Nitrospirae bacterium]|nr:acetyl-CoA carboxylase biotin carboxyl carrier protein [Nitrospirota bacterium]